jgi:hypothetical protein
MKEKAQVLFERFLRGFVAGGVASAIAVVPNDGMNLDDATAWLFRLILAALTGGITGGLLALDKYFRWTDQPQ